ncbi:MAG: hypothetical protein WCQ96_02810 [Patescibacteria group bacterium]
MATDSFALSPFQILKGIAGFLFFWYVQGSKDFWRREINMVKGVERDIGILINLKLILQPIYGDYSLIGKLIGPIFRLGRVLLGCLFVILLSGLIVVCYALWLLLPPVALVMICKNLFYILAE